MLLYSFSNTDLQDQEKTVFFVLFAGTIRRDSGVLHRIQSDPGGR